VLTIRVVIDGTNRQGDLHETPRPRTEVKAKAPAAVTRNILLPEMFKEGVLI
jgi:hypothetical protein